MLYVLLADGTYQTTAPLAANATAAHDPGRALGDREPVTAARPSVHRQRAVARYGNVVEFAFQGQYRTRGVGFAEGADRSLSWPRAERHRLLRRRDAGHPLGLGQRRVQRPGHPAATTTLAGRRRRPRLRSSRAAYGQTDRPDYLRGDLDPLPGALNSTLGSGRHPLMISDEAARGRRHASASPTPPGRRDPVSRPRARRRSRYKAPPTALRRRRHDLDRLGRRHDPRSTPRTARRRAHRHLAEHRPRRRRGQVDLQAGEDGFFVLDTQGAVRARAAGRRRLAAVTVDGRAWPGSHVGAGRVGPDGRVRLLTARSRADHLRHDAHDDDPRLPPRRQRHDHLRPRPQGRRRRHRHRQRRRGFRPERGRATTTVTLAGSPTARWRSSRSCRTETQTFALPQTPPATDDDTVHARDLDAAADHLRRPGQRQDLRRHRRRRHLRRPRPRPVLRRRQRPVRHAAASATRTERPSTAPIMPRSPSARRRVGRRQRHDHRRRRRRRALRRRRAPTRSTPRVERRVRRQSVSAATTAPYDSTLAPLPQILGLITTLAPTLRRQRPDHRRRRPRRAARRRRRGHDRGSAAATTSSLGDHGVAAYDDTRALADRLSSCAPATSTTAAATGIEGGDGDDLLIGGSAGDSIDGDAGDDLDLRRPGQPRRPHDPRPLPLAGPRRGAGPGGQGRRASATTTSPAARATTASSASSATTCCSATARSRTRLAGATRLAGRRRPARRADPRPRPSSASPTATTTSRAAAATTCSSAASARTT